MADDLPDDFLRHLVGLAPPVRPPSGSSLDLVMRAARAVNSLNPLVIAAHEHPELRPSLYRQCAKVCVEIAALYTEAARAAEMELLAAEAERKP